MGLFTYWTTIPIIIYNCIEYIYTDYIGKWVNEH